MRLAVTGSSGFLGQALTAALSADEHQVLRIVRGAVATSGQRIAWNPDTGAIDAAALSGVEAVVHLAGEPIMGRWTSSKKSAILSSRLNGTRLLSRTLAALTPPPAVLVCASAIGYYGHRGDDLLREDSPPGHGFLAEVCQAWEAAADAARQAGIRTVHLRIGIVLGRAGGALAALRPIFQLGGGGMIGNGTQWWSWVALDDVVGAIRYAVRTSALAGAVNVTAPKAVTNAEFTRSLGRVLRRPTLLPLPAPIARLVLGEAAEALLLASARVEPHRLLASGFRFRYPELPGALHHLLG